MEIYSPARKYSRMSNKVMLMPEELPSFMGSCNIWAMARSLTGVLFGGMRILYEVVLFNRSSNNIIQRFTNDVLTLQVANPAGRRDAQKFETAGVKRNESPWSSRARQGRPPSPTSPIQTHPEHCHAENVNHLWYEPGPHAK